MIINVDNLQLLFPYKYVYPEQYSYMHQLKTILDSKGHGILEMPSGSGKTICILAISVIFLIRFPKKFEKLIYCTRTVPEVENASKELKKLLVYYKRYKLLQDGTFLLRHVDDSNIEINTSLLGVVLSCRKNLCLNEDAMHLPSRTEVDSIDLTREALVVFDEAHNIDNVCIDTMSVTLTPTILQIAEECVHFLQDKVKFFKDSHADVLEQEYNNILKGLPSSSRTEILSLPMTIPTNYVDQTIPGNIRKIDHFLHHLKRFVQYMKARLKIYDHAKQSISSFLSELYKHTYLEPNTLRFSSERLQILTDTLQIYNFENISKLKNLVSLCDFATLIGYYTDSDKFSVVWSKDSSIRNYISDSNTNSIVRLCCLDSSIAFKPILSFKSILLTSGTLTPMSMYSKLLNFTPLISTSILTVLPRQSILPIIVSKGNDQIELSTRHESRDDPNIIRNYGDLLLSMVRVTPDGIICFFPSYSYMEYVLSEWYHRGVLDQIQKYKLIYIETQDINETNDALVNFKKSCNCGRGAVLISVARGKVSEGVDFKHHFGRLVMFNTYNINLIHVVDLFKCIIFGIPYLHTQNAVFQVRLEYLTEKLNISQRDYLAFDAMRHTAQCAGRVLRSKKDYGAMIFADNRYERSSNYSKLPVWITNELTSGNKSLSTENAVHEVKNFFSSMGNDFKIIDSKGHAIFDELGIKNTETKKKILEKTLVDV
ncbi:hypothetical protein A3Q56_03566 [Intoshia linei]|uniref:DNA 5'-3' helicase n=1 Tax=Intoshia linei TaxID=1819745 RepID=A0A177B5K1_9BILA|nr:hypothetical protein A3Q56_03566 [Intoshia linei]